jgi:hypothetical protein
MFSLSANVPAAPVWLGCRGEGGRLEHNLGDAIPDRPVVSHIGRKLERDQSIVTTPFHRSAAFRAGRGSAAHQAAATALERYSARVGARLQ